MRHNLSLFISKADCDVMQFQPIQKNLMHSKFLLFIFLVQHAYEHTRGHQNSDNCEDSNFDIDHDVSARERGRGRQSGAVATFSRILLPHVRAGLNEVGHNVMIYKRSILNKPLLQ